MEIHVNAFLFNQWNFERGKTSVKGTLTKQNRVGGAILTLLSKVINFCITTSGAWLTQLHSSRRAIFNPISLQIKPSVTHSDTFSRASRRLHGTLRRILIGSLNFLCSLWLAKVITLVIVLRHSIENSSTQPTNHAWNPTLHVITDIHTIFPRFRVACRWLR